MIRDLVRTACIIATLAVAASLLVETRQRLAAIDLAHRQAVAWQGGYVPSKPASPSLQGHWRGWGGPPLAGPTRPSESCGETGQNIF
jgi:hypothetical protein